MSDNADNSKNGEELNSSEQPAALPGRREMYITAAVITIIIIGIVVVVLALTGPSVGNIFSNIVCCI